MKGTERVRDLNESVIREMTRKAKEYDAINLSQGYPEYPTHDHILEEAKKAIDSGLNQYSITWGMETLRSKITEKLRDFNHLEYDPEFEITITCGASEAIMSAILGLVEEDDEVLIFQPFYENYVPAVSMASGKPRFTTIGRDLDIDREDIKKKVGEDTKAMILNTPHNPTGKVFQKDELKFIRDICIDEDVLLITDEIYERIIYEGEHISPASLKDMRERTVTIGGFSKVYSVTGWRVGYVAAPKELMKPIRKAHDYTTVCAPTPFQKASIKALALPEDYYDEMVKYYSKGREIVYEGLKKTEMDPLKPEGAYYMLANIENYDMNDREFVNHLVKEKGVAIVPGTSFFDDGGENLVRFCFSQEIDSLNTAMERIRDS
ncbi:MAG: aminotransferase class I/II-fold pyridoxal phosphate-dependent enzyme [Candidatus Thermoplasmatota archaeon]|nr:aminotransferase class I/II-fold pyridoxal phosphate-dependent enzyme [Candidatus Thermoplasmatota archaeon]MBS3789442.1 aminotransferase class I/II-fold pyridoxal phosphate-dependent enzyme [Candidatus Thermoplasmatota archaeon]